MQIAFLSYLYLYFLHLNSFTSYKKKPIQQKKKKYYLPLYSHGGLFLQIKTCQAAKVTTSQQASLSFPKAISIWGVITEVGIYLLVGFTSWILLPFPFRP